MSNEQPSRPKRSGSNASPMGSTLAIVIAIAAVVIGFLILNKIRGSDSKAAPAVTTPSTVDPSLLPPPVNVTAGPTTTVFTTTGATVLVANSSKQDKVAKKLSTALAGKNFTMAEPTTGSEKVADTVIQYSGDPAALAVAQSVAITMGIDPATVAAWPTPLKLKDPTTIGAATVLVLLGDDRAGKTLDQMTSKTTTTGNSSPTANSSPAAVTATT